MAEKKIKEINQQGVDYIIDTGIPVKRVVFHDTVLSYGDGSQGTPEFAFYATNAKPSRTAIMWYHALGLLLEQKGKYKIVPLANVKEVDLV